MLLKLKMTCFHVETNASFCLLHAMQLGFGLSRCICKKHKIISIVILPRPTYFLGVGLGKIPPEVQMTRKFDELLLPLCKAVYKQNTIKKWTKGCTFPFPKKGDFGITKNYRGIMLRFIMLCFAQLYQTWNQENFGFQS